MAAKPEVIDMYFGGIKNRRKVAELNRFELGDFISVKIYVQQLQTI